MRLSKVLIFIIFVSMIGYACADTDEDDELYELLEDIIFFIAGVMWRSCMDNEKCASVAIPTVIAIACILLVIRFIHWCIYGYQYEDDDYYSKSKLRRGFAFGAGYLARI
jgi:nitrogen fixation-related uncharacterized protein